MKSRGSSVALRVTTAAQKAQIVYGIGAEWFFNDMVNVCLLP